MIIIRTASIPIQKSEYIMVKWKNKVNAIIPHKHKRQSANLLKIVIVQQMSENWF